MFCQCLIDKGMIRIDHVEDRSIVLKHVLKKPDGLTVHALSQRRKLWIQFFVLIIISVEVPEVQPLAGELFGKPFGTRILQHPPHLLPHHLFVMQFAEPAKFHQLRVRHRRPQEETEPCS